MRISDWSSDVCSSDLPRIKARQVVACPLPQEEERLRPRITIRMPLISRLPPASPHELRAAGHLPPWPCWNSNDGQAPSPALPIRLRSEEHTSELQSLMRISYAVFCLKKKTQSQQIQTNH